MEKSRVNGGRSKSFPLDPDSLIRRHVMGHNTKLAGHYVQLRITLTTLTSDYRGEQPHCSRKPRQCTL